MSTRLISTALLVCAVLLTSACSKKELAVPSGAAAYEVIGPPDLSATGELYRLVPGDTISVGIFQEPELSLEKATLDAVGNVQLPLIGQVSARNLTSVELSQSIATLLARKYVVDPKVVVGVVERSKQLVTVEGQVTEPGVFEIDRTYTLLSALARAKSPSKTAKLDEVVVFRTINSERMGAVFNLQDIRAGRAADPQILGGDVVVVGYSSVKGAFRDFLQMAPIFNTFLLF